ncbi:phage tail protein [Agrobacterium tumefaciens]|uniref:phage tail protein n=1 Tax=Agrobacterium tumefaciens TaxID=358 RepID=UPI0021D120DE|nr:phage tail protein [Agrobacterium tumefaciens]UXS04475.1 phage tail protein [Agrobacterium tumefaciens]
MTAPAFGMQFFRPTTETVPALGADFSKMLVIETSADASNAEFPIDTPKRISSSNSEAVAALGTGLLADAVKGINDQLTSLNAGADVTIVRVAEGANAAATAAAIAEVINSITDIPSQVNATPRIVVAGRTAWRPDLDTANPVIVALQANLGKILAIAPVDVDDTSSANAIDARETMSSERLMPIGVAARVYAGADVVTRPMAPRVAGLIARVDNEGDGLPFNPFANQPLYGLAGLSRKIPFSLLDGSTEGQQMLAANVAIVTEGETGVDGAVADGGFVFIGTDNAQTGELWEQMHQVRGTDYIVTQIMGITRQFLGKNKITANMAEAWINSIAYALKDHKVADRILGYTPRTEMFKADLNSPENIRLGTLALEIGIEPAPVFKRADHTIRRYRPAVEGLVAEIIARLAQTA